MNVSVLKLIKILQSQSLHDVTKKDKQTQNACFKTKYYRKTGPT